MESISPNIFVKNINETINFYKQLGFALTTTVPEEGDIIFAMMNCGNVVFMFQTFESLGNELPNVSRQNGGSLLLYIQTTGIKDFFEKIETYLNSKYILISYYLLSFLCLLIYFPYFLISFFVDI